MSSLIQTKGNRFFRWHDSGDLFDPRYLSMIVQVARETHPVQHWLPTKEHDLVRRFVRTKALPDNLLIRLSAHMIGEIIEDPVFCTHSVGAGAVTGDVTSVGFRCPAAYEPGRKVCGACRACWLRLYRNVDFKRKGSRGGAA